MVDSEDMRAITPEQEEAIDIIGAALRDAYLKCQKAGLHPLQLDKLESAYEWYLDAVMYGYYRAIFDGWPEDRNKWDAIQKMRAERRAWVQAQVEGMANSIQ